MLDTLKKWRSNPKEETKLEEPKGIFNDPVSIVIHEDDNWRGFRIPNHESTIFMVQVIDVADIELHGITVKSDLEFDCFEGEKIEHGATKQLGLWESNDEDLIEIRPDIYREQLQYKNEYKVKAKINRKGRINPSEIQDDILSLLDN